MVLWARTLTRRVQRGRTHQCSSVFIYKMRQVAASFALIIALNLRKSTYREGLQNPEPVK